MKVRLRKLKPLCEHCVDALVPGAILDSQTVTHPERTYVERCDDCALFEDDPAAARALGAAIGAPAMVRDGRRRSAYLAIRPHEANVRAEMAKKAVANVVPKTKPREAYYPKVISGTDGATLASIVLQIRDILWPGKNPDAEWDSETVEWVADVLREHKLDPRWKE